MRAIPLCFLSQRSAGLLEQLGLEGKRGWGGEAPLPSQSLAFFGSPLPCPFPTPPPATPTPSLCRKLHKPRFGKILRLLAFDLEYSVIFSSYLTVLFKALSPSSLLPLQPLGDQAQKAQKDLEPWATSLSLSQKQIAGAVHGPGQATVYSRREC